MKCKNWHRVWIWTMGVVIVFHIFHRLLADDGTLIKDLTEQGGIIERGNTPGNPVIGLRFKRPTFRPDVAEKIPGTDNATIKDILELKDLQYLEMRWSYVKDEKLSDLKGLTKLTKLDLNGAFFLGDGCIGALRPIRHQLTHLNLGGTRITDKSVGTLSEFDHLTWLYLDGVNITDKGLVKLKDLKLTTLSIHGANVTGKCLKEFKTLKELKNVRNHNLSDKDVDDLKELKNLTSLDITETGVSLYGRRKLQKALPNCKITHSYVGQD